jgi:hypothetical protein
MRRNLRRFERRLSSEGNVVIFGKHSTFDTFHAVFNLASAGSSFQVH